VTVHEPTFRYDGPPIVPVVVAPGRTAAGVDGREGPGTPAGTMLARAAVPGAGVGAVPGAEVRLGAASGVEARPRSDAAGARLLRRHAAPAASLLGAVALLAVAVARADVTTSGGTLGLVEVLPATWWLAVAAVTVGFARLLVASPGRGAWLAAHLVVMVVLLYATPGLIEPHARFPTAWTHVGFVDRIVETGRVEPGYDARYSWPGAFSFGALLVQVTGAESARDLLRFTPVVVNLLLLAPLSVIVGHVTRDPRVRWCALWLVVTTSWVGQDYLAPQAIALLCYLTVVALLLRWFRRTSGPPPRFDLLAPVRRRRPNLVGDAHLGGFVTPTPPTSPLQRFGLVAIVASVGAVLAFTHQLTPLVLPVVAAVLVVVGRVDRPLVPAVLAVCAAGWLVFGTTSFLRSNLVDLTSGLGDIGAVVDDNVDSRTSPDPLRQLVLGTRLALTAGVGLLAAVGLGRQWRRRRVDWALVGLAAAPVSLLALNSYGGEMVLRVSLLSLPFLAVLGAFGLVAEGPRPGRGRWPAGVALVAVSLATVPAFVVARYGNEAFERVESTDIAAWDHVATHARRGSVVVVPDFAGPWRYRGLMDVDYRVYADLVDGAPDPDGLDEVLGDGTSTSAGSVFGDGPADAYVVLGSASGRYGVIAEGYPEGWSDDLAGELLDTGAWQVDFRAGDTQVLVRRAELVAP
jgi:hypothetical protein